MRLESQRSFYIMPSLNLSELFSSLVGLGAQQAAERTSEPLGGSIATTVRLSPEIRRFYEAQAAAFGDISLAAMVTMTLEGVMRETQAERAGPTQRLHNSIAILRDRFAYLHKAHGIDQAMLAEMYAQHGAKLSTFSNEASYTDFLSTAVISDAAARFHVHPDWLVGDRETCSISRTHWYKGPSEFCRRVVEVAHAGLKPEVVFLRRENADFTRARRDGDAGSEEPIGLLIQASHATPEGRRFQSMEVCEGQRWNYEPCRIDFKTLILWSSRAESQRLLSVRGLELPVESLRALYEGALLPIDALETRRSGCAWHPDDYTDDPKASVCAKDADEREAVLERYSQFRLDEHLKELRSAQ